MRVAVCSPEMDERHTLSRLLETTLLRRGVLPEVSLFPILQELVEAPAYQDVFFDLVLVSWARGMPTLEGLCRRAPVILIGGKEDGPAAFDMGAGYFIESPVKTEALERGLTRCLRENKEENKQ